MKKDSFVLKIQKGSLLPKLKDKFVTIDLSDDVIEYNSTKIDDSNILIDNIKKVYLKNQKKLCAANEIIKKGNYTRPKNTATASLYIKDNDVELDLDCYVQEIGTLPMNILDTIFKLVIEYQSIGSKFNRMVISYAKLKNNDMIKKFVASVISVTGNDPFWGKMAQDILEVIILFSLKRNPKNFRWDSLKEIFVDEEYFINLCGDLVNSGDGVFLKNVSEKDLNQYYNIICKGLRITNNDKVLNLLNKENFKNLFSLCVGKVYSNQLELKEYFGDYKHWETDINLGKLFVDEKEYNVEYIGVKSDSENMWFSAEMEKPIPVDFTKMIIETRKNMFNKGLGDCYYYRKTLREDLTSDMLAIVYVSLTRGDVCYFKGVNGDLSVYMYIKDLPQSIFEKIGSNKFVNRVMEIIQKFDVNHKLMIKSFLINNNCGVIERDNKIIGLFDDKSEITFVFDDCGRLQEVEGELS